MRSAFLFEFDREREIVGPARVVLYFEEQSGKKGRVAQLGERGVRNAEVEGSNPFASTKDLRYGKTNTSG